MKLLSNIKIGFDDCENIKKVSWRDFEIYGSLIAQEIKKYKEKNICLVAVARGGLPLLTYISHKLSIRNISVIQLKMTNSDNPFDYGNLEIILEGIREDLDNYIILEDIIYKGQSTGKVLEILKSKNKKVLGIYTLIADENFNVKMDTPIYSASLLKQEKWIKFPWEND